MQGRKWVGVSYLLAFSAVGMLAFFTVPQHPTALAAQRASKMDRAHVKGSTQLAAVSRSHRQSDEIRLQRARAQRAVTQAPRALGGQMTEKLDYDTVTVGPYGSYDAQTYYFNPTGVEKEGDSTLYQPEIIFDALAPPGGRLVPWNWNEIDYQMAGDMAPPQGSQQQRSLIPYSWDDVIYQTPAS